jgi:hypothetical protein
VLAVVALDHKLLAVATDDAVFGDLASLVDDLQKLEHVAEKLLTDAFTCSVYGTLDVGRCKNHCCGEHGDGNCFAEPKKKATVLRPLCNLHK